MLSVEKWNPSCRNIETKVFKDPHRVLPVNHRHMGIQCFGYIKWKVKCQEILGASFEEQKLEVKNLQASRTPFHSSSGDRARNLTVLFWAYVLICNLEKFQNVWDFLKLMEIINALYKHMEFRDQVLKMTKELIIYPRDNLLFLWSIPYATNNLYPWKDVSVHKISHRFEWCLQSRRNVVRPL